ncbi:uncharacterized protein LOC133987256 [Scomber scombrus]|uniref:uncharacterized protein LOC133987255 n=1 Tax=Scomber scombrus TaxID=13677 RepID=UPI002DDC7593|nr:uncharacterized protein LOC133987255 [Scomber scombrus]XP_062282547.1 uncharacterized protein LOC133987256 [Scomber scombrus]
MWDHAFPNYLLMSQTVTRATRPVQPTALSSSSRPKPAALTPILPRPPASTHLQPRPPAASTYGPPPVSAAPIMLVLPAQPQALRPVAWAILHPELCPSCTNSEGIHA